MKVLRKGVSLIIIIITTLALTSCDSGVTQKGIENTNNTIGENTVYSNLTAKQVVQKLSKEINHISNFIAYDETTDINNLLGRPNQYVSKTNFSDDRITQYSEDEPIGGTVEQFINSDDAESRKLYVSSVYENTSLEKEYLYLYENYLLRIRYSITPSEAEIYNNAFIKIIDNSK